MTAVDAVAAQEEAFFFDCQGDALLGVLHRPAQHAPAAAAATGVVVIVGGPQYRAGSHRQFVLLARQMATAGHPVLRFDARGMGDSSGAMRGFEEISADIGAAIDELIRRLPTVERVVLWGLCDGASAALLYLHERGDQRVRGLCLLNPWVRSEASLARTRVKHYYLQRLLQREFWLKLLRGRVAASAITDYWREFRSARKGLAAEAQQPFVTRMARAWHQFDGALLLILSGRDFTAREFVDTTKAHPAWSGSMKSPLLSVREVALADHTFSDAGHQQVLAITTLKWLQERGGDATSFAARESATTPGPTATA